MNHQQQKIIECLKTDKKSYPHKVSKIRLEETHISWILLTGPFAYKIKKQLKFGRVLDFSNLRLRKKFCDDEVRLNKILCGNMYLGVVKIVNKNGKFRISNLHSKEKALEYAVKMREIPQKYRMDNLISAKLVNEKTIDRLTDELVTFHRITPTSSKISKYGNPRFMKKKIKENFRTLSTLTKISPKYEKKLISFTEKNKKLFFNRIKQNKIREIHGDLYLKNIFIVKNQFYLYDRLEFNDLLRFADVTEDVAHLSMDLDFNKKNNLRKRFVSQYLTKTQDHNLENLLYFLMSFKASIRAKVSLFYAKNEPVKKKRISHLQDSKRLLKLAESYFKLF